MITFDDFYNAVKLKVVNLLKEKEIEEGNLNFEKIVGEVMKEFMLNDNDIKRRQIVPRDLQNYQTKNILTRLDSRRKLNKDTVRIK